MVVVTKDIQIDGGFTGAYLVTLKKIKSKITVTALITAGDRSKRISTDSGRYRATISEIGSNERSPWSVEVDIREGPSPVILPNSPPLPGAIVRREEQMRLLRPSIEDAMGIGSRQEDINLQLLGAQTDFGGTAQQSSRPFLGKTPFSVAISEKKYVEAGSHWSSPENVWVSTESRPGIGFSISIAQRTPSKTLQRLRLSLSVKGRPALRIAIPTFNEGVLFTIANFGQDRDLSVAIRPNSGRIDALVGALAHLSIEEANAVLTWEQGVKVEDALRTLQDKYQDQWAATAAALLLIKTRQLDRKTGSWVQNLARVAPHISDTAVAAAWATALLEKKRSVSEKAVFKMLHGAYRSGSPCFALTSNIAIDLLSSLQSTAVDTDIKSAAAAELLRWFKRKRRSFALGAFEGWEQPGRKLKRGAFPSIRYSTLVDGMITGSSIEELNFYESL